MDQAVALVETYLRVNGYFAVTEYPVLEATKGRGFQSATDLDVMAVRFPGAGRGGQTGNRVTGIVAPDPELASGADQVDMIIGEVKEGKAELNAAATNPRVLSAALVRFGCCRPDDVGRVVQSLLREGESLTHCGHRVRLVAFGSSKGNGVRCPHRVVLLRHITAFLRAYIREHWSAIRHAQFKDPVFAMLAMEYKSGGVKIMTASAAMPARIVLTRCCLVNVLTPMLVSRTASAKGLPSAEKRSRAPTRFARQMPNSPARSTRAHTFHVSPAITCVSASAKR